MPAEILLNAWSKVVDYYEYKTGKITKEMYRYRCIQKQSIKRWLKDYEKA